MTHSGNVIVTQHCHVTTRCLDLKPKKKKKNFNLISKYYSYIQIIKMIILIVSQRVEWYPTSDHRVMCLIKGKSEVTIKSTKKKHLIKNKNLHKKMKNLHKKRKNLQKKK